MYQPRHLRALRRIGLLAAMLAASAALSAAEPPTPPTRADAERAIAAAADARPPEGTPLRPLTIVLLAGPKDHGENEHDYPRWQARWALLLGGKAASDERAANLFGPDRPHPAVGAGAPGVRVIRANPWPSAEEWEAADLVVAFCYLPWNPSRLEEVGRFLARGGGLVLIHSATWTRPRASPEVAEIVGVGGFQFYRHGSLLLEIAMPEHPVCRGLPAQIRWLDEPYWPPTPPGPAERIEVLAASREALEPGRNRNVAPQPQFWSCPHGKGRVFGCVPGHYTWTFDDPFFRLLLLRGMAWAAGENPYRFDPLALRCAAIAEE